MAVVKPRDLKNIAASDIDAKIKEFTKELIKLNAQRATGTIPKKPSDIKNLRKNIARMYTKKNLKEGTQKNE